MFGVTGIFIQLSLYSTSMKEEAKKGVIKNVYS
jgi:hypothetical protein